MIGSLPGCCARAAIELQVAAAQLLVRREAFHRVDGTPDWSRLRCRVCARVAYASQNERPMDRAMRRARKIRYSLGGDSSLLDPIPEIA
jgi:hypothetical protein